jgi:hypothetical protein
MHVTGNVPSLDAGRCQALDLVDESTGEHFSLKFTTDAGLLEVRMFNVWHMLVGILHMRPLNPLGCPGVMQQAPGTCFFVI